MTYYTKVDEPTEKFFRQAAINEGLTYTAWCKKYGILDGAALAKIHRHEVSLEARQEGIVSQFVDAEEWTREYKRASRVVTSEEVCKDSPNAASPSDRNDAAEAAQ